VDPHDTKAIAHAIEYLLTHSEEAQLMGSRGREAIERQYNRTTEERQLLALYNPPCSQPRGRHSEQSWAA
jgi:glycosyltransferase involved in cell wall biosynthesis